MRLMMLACCVLVAVITAELRYGGLHAQVRQPQANAMHTGPAVPQRIVAAKPALDQWLAAILARPLFAPDRSPAAGSVAADVGLPRLTGVIAFDNDRIAIFQPAGNAKPILARNGDTIGGWQVVTIAGDAVGLRKANARVLINPKFDNLAGTAAIAFTPAPTRWEAPAPSGLQRARWSNPQLQP